MYLTVCQQAFYTGVNTNHLVASPTTQVSAPGANQERDMTGRKPTSANSQKTAPLPIQRTSAGLRDAIFDEIDAIRRGASNPTRANAVAKLATGIVETVRMELEVQRHLRQHDATATVSVTASNPLGSPLVLGG